MADTTTTGAAASPSSRWVSRHHPARLPGRSLAAGSTAVVVAVAAAVAIGPTTIAPQAVVRALADRLPFVDVDSGLSPLQSAIVTDVRLPRALVALVVGTLLATAGAAYQSVFRNPLADPYLLGAAGGAGLGVTVVIVGTGSALAVSSVGIPVAAFVGALAAVGLAYALGSSADRHRSSTTIILAGVAVGALCAAAQTFLLQLDDEAVRDVYAWLLGRLNSANWGDLRVLLPYAIVALGTLLLTARRLDVLAFGDLEAEALGAHPRRIRLLVVAAASLGTAAAVAVAGLIGFVGIIVPHAVRLRCGPSYRRILPLSALYGGAFLCLADLAARTLLAPAEIPIGVVTAAVGAPFFLFVLRSSRSVAP